VYFATMMSRSPATTRGNGWESLGGGLPGYALSVAAWDGALVASTDAPEQVLAYDGSAWSSMNAGLPANTRIHVLAEHQGALYGGLGTEGSPAEFLWRWTGSLWEPVPGIQGEVRALASYSGELYMAGQFGIVNGQFMRGITAYNGTSYRSLGQGISSGNALALHVFGGMLYVGGSFHSAGPVVVSGLAGYDGATWSSIGGIEGDTFPVPEVRALGEHGGNLVVAGRFNSIGGVPAESVALHDGAAWSPLGSGIGLGPTIFVSALLSTDGSLWAGGRIGTAGGKPSRNIARWTDSATTSAPGPERGERPVLVAMAPNPFRASTRIEFVLAQKERVRVEIVDVRGRRVRTLSDAEYGPGPVALAWDGRSEDGTRTAAGVYFVIVSRDISGTSRRLVRLP